MKAICIDSSNKPSKVPIEQWVKEGEVYTTSIGEEQLKLMVNSGILNMNKIDEYMFDYVLVQSNGATEREEEHEEDYIPDED